MSYQYDTTGAPPLEISEAPAKPARKPRAKKAAATKPKAAPIVEGPKPRKPRARKIVEAAQAEANRLKNECEDYCDHKLASFEIVLERTLKMVGAGRDKLQGAASTGAGPAGGGGAERDEEPGGPAVFDQDLG